MHLKSIKVFCDRTAVCAKLLPPNQLQALPALGEAEPNPPPQTAKVQRLNPNTLSVSVQPLDAPDADPSSKLPFTTAAFAPQPAASKTAARLQARMRQVVCILGTPIVDRTRRTQ